MVKGMNLTGGAIMVEMGLHGVHGEEGCAKGAECQARGRTRPRRDSSGKSLSETTETRLKQTLGSAGGDDGWRFRHTGSQTL